MADTSRTDLSRFLNPRGIAVVGVSSDAARIGGQTLSLLTDFGYTGKIYPVESRATRRSRGSPAIPISPPCRNPAMWR